MSSPTATLQPIEMAGDEEEGYYGIPVIHEPHWKWLIVGYFYCGGVAGSSAVIGSLARLAGRDQDEPTAHLATYISALALAPCPVLLILDLGRPARFLNMLRVFKPSSPMSLGVWGVALFSALTAANVLGQIAEDLSYWRQGRPLAGAKRAQLILALPSALSGFFMAGYSGVLLAATAVPLWSKRPALLGPLLLASAMSSGAAAITAATAIFDPGSERGLERMHRLDALASTAESALLLFWVARLGSTAKPLTQGFLGYVVKGSVLVGLVAPAVISGLSRRWNGRARRAAVALASAMTLCGVFGLRYAVVFGGRESANDPTAVFELTR